MTGVEIVANLLVTTEAVTDVISAPRIKAGMLPQGITLPALLLREISVIERLKLKRTGKIRVATRVEITVRAGTYQEQKDVLALVVRTCAGRTGDVGGGSNVAITNAGAGPDLIGDGGVFEQSQDFRVSHEIDA